MSLAALRDVYNPLAPKPESKQPLQDWKESVPVILLSEYLKIKKQFGIRLYQNDGEPFLHLTPGLKAADRESERWEVVQNAAQLFLDAADDLKELMGNDKISLPTLRR